MEEIRMRENNKFLQDQIITYLGNKRSLNPYIENEIKKIKKSLNKDKLVTLDLFSGSGIVARMLKKHSEKLIANDLEEYSQIINECYLSNHSDFDRKKYDLYKEKLDDLLSNKVYKKGIITSNYAPKNDLHIKKGERCFYTTENAQIIDTIRDFVDTIEEPMKKYFLAPLLYQASVNTNTAGIFKGFYKDSSTGIGKYGGNGEFALKRIKGKIQILEPIFSNFETDVLVTREDANNLVKREKNFDVVYIDPPYNQHPYGSNYFMLNLILSNKMPDNISKVSGIPKNWNRSDYNYKAKALNAFDDLIKNIDSKFIIISYNSEGIISYDEMIKLLKPYGELTIKEIVYNTFRGSRNLSERSLYVQEYLFVLKRGD
jgi:adenine-specific DNA-methyltransferase